MHNMNNEVPIFVRSVSQVEATDIEFLIENNVRESKYIDYKSDPYGLADSERKGSSLSLTALL